ncbi:MAG: hypothetical protein R3B47_10865 [Bacteroidia bacterium]
MSYPPLRSWPMNQDDFPPPQPPPDHWFFRMRKWFWPVILLTMGFSGLGVCIAAVIAGKSIAIFMTAVMLVALAVICIVAATITGFALAFIEFGKLSYEQRVELIAGIGSMVFFITGLVAGLSLDFLAR